MEKSDSGTEGGTNETAQRSERLFGNQPGGGDGIAKILREARENKGEEIARVANRLRIRAAYLQAIEDGRYRELPGDAYAIGLSVLTQLIWVWTVLRLCAVLRWRRPSPARLPR